MNKEEYKLIIESLENYAEHIGDKDLKEKLIKKINLFIKHDEIQEKYQNDMAEMNKEMSELMQKEKPEEDK